MPDGKSCILIVEDEAAYRRLLRKGFELEHYRVLEASNSQQAINAVNEQKVDLITLDVNLDGEDGLKLATELRVFTDVPIIMVSGKGELIDRVLGLEIGADDYITKPFEIREVLARVKAALRRHDLNQKNIRDSNRVPSGRQLRFADCCLCPGRRDLILSDGQACNLTSAEFDLLYALASCSQAVMTRDQIMDAMKGKNWNPTDRTIDNQIARLRKKLCCNHVPDCIKTVRNRGYMFTQPLAQDNACELV